MLNLDAIEARAREALLRVRDCDLDTLDEGTAGDVEEIQELANDIPALVAELRAARADITEMAYRGTALSGAVDRLEGIVATQAAELRAAREVVEAAVDLAERDGHKDDLCDDCGLGGHTSPCPWQSLDTSLAAYRAVVGEQTDG